MEAMSPVFAAFGVVEFDVLNDVSHWLDGPVGPLGTGETSGWPGPSGDKAILIPVRSAGREG